MKKNPKRKGKERVVDRSFLSAFEEEEEEEEEEEKVQTPVSVLHSLSVSCV